MRRYYKRFTDSLVPVLGLEVLHVGPVLATSQSAEYLTKFGVADSAECGLGRCDSPDVDSVSHTRSHTHVFFASLQELGRRVLVRVQCQCNFRERLSAKQTFC